MKSINSSFKDLIEGEKLTFLVGAGCSIDPPSCLAAGHSMMEAVIRYTCAKSEIETILELKELRFEQLVEIIRDQIDPELNLIDYYEECDKPNLQHYYLVEMVKRGHFIMTTNFDFLIEHALLNSGISKQNIIPVITKHDFKRYNNPIELLKHKKKMVYKIHGSTKNIITGEETRDSLIATIEALGLYKEGLNIFQIEPFKRPLFDNISDHRTLVIIGYSGSDDFDVVPTLKVLKNLHNVIWINHISDDDGFEHIYEIHIDTNDRHEKINQILAQIKRTGYENHVYRVDVNTTRMIKDLLHGTPELSTKHFSINLMNWLKEHIRNPNEFDKNLISYKIYNAFNLYRDAKNCLETILHIAEENNNLKWKSIALNNLGEIYRVTGSYDIALNHYEQALKLFEQLEDLPRKAIALNNIGLIYYTHGKYTQALEKLKKAVRIDEQLGNLSAKANCTNNIGMVYKDWGKYQKALKMYKLSLKISEKLGNPLNRIKYLNNISTLYQIQGINQKALKGYKEALEISVQLGDLSGKAMVLNNIGEVFRNEGNYKKAFMNYEEALGLYEKIGDILGKIKCLNNIVLVCEAVGKDSEAHKKFEDSLKLSEELKSPSEKASCLINIASLCQKRCNHEEADEKYRKAIIIIDELGDPFKKAILLNNIGSNYFDQRNFPKALNFFEQSFQIFCNIGLRESRYAKILKENIDSVKHKMR